MTHMVLTYDDVVHLFRRRRDWLAVGDSPPPPLVVEKIIYNLKKISLLITHFILLPQHHF